MRWLNEAIPNRRETAIGTALLACALLAAPAAAQPIDFFTDAAPPIVDPPPGAGAFSATPGATILGGERDAEVRLLSGPGPVTSATAAGGPLSFAVVTPPSSRAVLELQWDGADASPLLDPVGLGGVDFIAAGSNSLHLAFGAVTGVGEVIVDVYSSATLSSRSAGVVTGTGDLYFPFSSFLPTGSSGPAAFTSVGAVVVQIFADSDATFDVLLFDALGPAVEATSVAAEVIGDADGLADPGETLEYTVNVTGGGGVAEGAEYDDLLADPNLSAAFSVEATPLARDDLLEGVGNFDLTVAAPGLLANDVDPDGGTVTLDTAASDTVTAKGGTVSYPDGLGGFTYTPPVGFKGVDRFTYEIDDDEGDTTTGVATILIDELVWFVNNSAGGDTDGDVGCAPPPCGTGLLSDPFGDFSSLNGVSGDVDSPGDTIFVFEGSGSYDTGAAPGLPLEPGQTLIGEGVDLVVDGVTLVVGEPSSRPTLSNTAGTSGDAVTLATDNTIRGLDLGDVPAASSRLTDGGGGVGTLTIGDVSAASTGGVIDVTGGGTLAVTFDTIVSTSSSGTPAINLAGVGGTLTVGNPGAGLDTTISGADAGIDISGSVGAASFSFGETSVTTDATGGDGVSLTGNGGATTAFSSLDVTTGAGDALVTDSATVTIGGVSNTIAATGGAALDASGTNVGAGGWTFDALTSSGSPTAGVDLGELTGNAGGPEVAVTGAIDIDAPAGNGVTIAGSTGGFTFGATSVDDPGGAGISLSSTSGLVTFASVAIDDTGGAGVAISGNTAAVTISGGFIGETAGSATTTAGNAVDIDSSMADVTIAAMIANTSSRSVEVTNSGGGAPNTITFSAAIDDDGTGIFLDNNDQSGGATINFSGGVALDTGASIAFRATNGGTVNVTGTNTIGSAAPLTNTALEIANTSIGASDVTFRSLRVNGATNGIILNNTGTAGGLKVTGVDGPCGNTALAKDCDGGLIDNTSRAVLLTLTSNTSLKNMRIQNTALDAIVGDRVTDGSGGAESSFEVIDSEFFDIGTSAGSDEVFDFRTNDGGATFNITGSLLLDGVLVDEDAGGASNGFAGNGLFVINNSGSLTVTVTDSAFRNTPATGDKAINLSARGTHGLTANVTDSEAIEVRGEMLGVIAEGSGASADVNFLRNRVLGDNTAPGFDSIGAGVQVAVNKGASATFDILDNCPSTQAGCTSGCSNCGFYGNFQDPIELSINDDGTNNGSLEGRVNRNRVENSTDVPINFLLDGNSISSPGAGRFNAVVEIENNHFQGTGSVNAPAGALNGAISLSVRDATTMTAGDKVDVRIRNNTFGTALSPLEGDQGMHINVFETNATVNLLIEGNQVVLGGVGGIAEPLLLRGRYASTVNATVTGNTFTNGGGGDGLEIRSQLNQSAASFPTVCLDLSGNTITDRARLRQLDVSTLNVVQASEAAAEAANGGVNVVGEGTVSYGAVASCTLPSAPTNP